ncbi:beta-1,4-galactosyltransferase 2-like [Labrus bergylta]|uniref:beta-1,4-galactosyltransferase 2-like n=1 Tax=Labrus bergylta TaxID=56723 RepID=UPI0010FB8C46|nr:beta-1,4-galactosyltransferase 2-like [Labrus bergylta]
MLWRLFKILSLFAFISTACFALFLYKKSSNLNVLTNQLFKAHGNNSSSRLLEGQETRVREFQSNDSKKIEASMVIEASKESEASMEINAAKENEASIGNEVSVKSEAPNAVQEKTQTPAPENKTIGLCPDTPPNLVGALRVEFDNERTLEQMREDAGSGLQMGGRFMPLDCIAQQKVAIIIPFRNRHDHLKYWLYYLHPILMRQQVDYGVYVINQDGEGVFNRAKLMNAGYVEALKEYDYDCFVFSDVDLVPMDDRNLYRCFDSPRHLAVAMDKFNFLLPYITFFGGVHSLSKEQFLRINGFPNTYWGWGAEDDDIYNRILFRGMKISRPNLIIGRYKMIKHLRDLHNEPNQRNPGKLHNTQWQMEKDGINSLHYTVKEIVKNKMYTFITVDIQAPQ